MRREIEELCLETDDGQVRHAALILFDRLLDFACKPIDIDPTNIEDERVRWAYNFRLKERAVQIEAINVALRRMLGREAAAPVSKERGSRELIANLGRIIDSERAKVLSVATTIDRGLPGGNDVAGEARPTAGVAGRLLDGPGQRDHHPDGPPPEPGTPPEVADQV